MYDVIGDIHGYADELVQLLDALGYQKAQGVYGHPERRVIFVGDFVDRGPKIRQVLEIVRPMIEEGKALAVMGNHEFNTLAYHTEDPDAPGQYLRRHSQKNEKQRRKTGEQLQHDELVSYLEWFRTLPMWLDLDGLRVVHACWEDQAISTITQALEGKQLTNAFLQTACKKANPLFAQVEIVLKGKEAALPQGMSFSDIEGSVRTEIRTRWYLSPHGQTYRSYALQTDEIPCDMDLEESVISQAVPYPTTAKPVFVGHYWLPAQWPELLADNVACLDYSVAKGGFLCAYRWNGEQKLKNENFVWVGEVGLPMLDYSQELQRRIGQFAGYLKKMYHRAHEDVHGSCFIIFEERPPTNGSEDAALSEAAKPALELVVAGFHDAGIRSVNMTDDISFIELPDEGWKEDDSQARFIQFSIEKNWFCMDMPLQTLYRAEAEQILRSRKGFFYLRDRPQFTLKEEDVDGYDPFRKVYVYGDEESAAEDMAFILFQVWRFPVDWRFFVKAAAFGDKKTDWEDGTPLE